MAESLRDVLSKLGLPPRKADAVSEQPGSAAPDVCPLCRGRGWVGHNLPVGHRDFGTVDPCECKEAQEREGRQSRLLKWSEMPEQMAVRMTFERFQPRDYQLAARQTAFSYAKGEMAEKWLVLCGEFGTGKTHLACAVLTWRREHPDSLAQGKYVNAPDFLDDLKDGFKDDTYSQRFDRYRDVGLLLLDDLGAHRPTEWAEEKLYQLLDHRSRNRMETIVTSNANPNQMAGRIISRMLDEGTGLARLVTMTGKDVRMKGAI